MVALFHVNGTHANAAALNVFAAASLTDSLKEISRNYEKRNEVKMSLNFGASSLLARQIAEGAPADIFFSADEARMDAVERNGLVLKGTRRSRLSNSLVVVVASDSALIIKSSHDLTNARVQRIALADPKTVPAGIYAREYLEKLRLWPAVASKVVPTDNVRAALSAVESGNVEVGIVYKTDAGISKKVKIAYQVPASDSPVISYPMAVMKESKQPEAAKRFLNYLDSEEAAQVFEKFGFIVRKQR